jgi:signal transduction histidine kinase
MKSVKNQPSSVQQIRRRLNLNLLRAFGTVVAILVVSMIGVTIFSILQNGQENPFFRAPNASLLEAYYIGKGNWNGISALLSQSEMPGGPFNGLDWRGSVLVDSNGMVIVDHGSQTTGMMGSMYIPQAQQNIVPLTVNGQNIGYLIQDQVDQFHPIRYTSSVINPIILVAIFLGIMTLVFSNLLTQRVVNPLSEVINAAERVGKGDLSARVPPGKNKDDLSILSDQFNDMANELERNDQERKAMTADIAHELRTPLTVLRGRLEGIVDGVYPANEASITPALEETYLLERLVEDLRLLTMAENHQLQYEIRSVDLKPLTQRVIEVFQPQAQDQNVEIHFSAPESGPTVIADPQRLEQVIGNIIGNSLRYIQGAGRIDAELSATETDVILSISDNGPGVPEDQLPYIFSRFWRSEKSRARATGGAGLGLTIARQLVEAQGGKIEAGVSAMGGLKITLTFPREDKA